MSDNELYGVADELPRRSNGLSGFTWPGKSAAHDSALAERDFGRELIAQRIANHKR